MMPTLLTAIHDQDEALVAIHFDRNAPGRQAFGAVRQASFDVRRNRKQPPVSCGHREHHWGGLAFNYTTRDWGSTRYTESGEQIACSCVKVRQQACPRWRQRVLLNRLLPITVGR
jgi:hypothetical protein